MKSTTLSKDIKNVLGEFGITSIVSEDMDYIDIGEDDSTITFTPISKIAKIKEDGLDPWKTNRVNMKAGKFFNKVFYIESSKLENLTNWYKTAYSVNKGNFDNIFEVVEGEAIRHWYNQRNYVPGGGSLNGSCMRGDGAAERLSLYVENPDVVKLLIMKKGDQLLSRALMWTTDRGVYIDRPYTRYDKDQMLYKRYADHKSYYNFYSRNNMIVLAINLKKSYTSNNIPYLDSFRITSTGRAKTRLEANV